MTETIRENRVRLGFPKNLVTHFQSKRKVEPQGGFVTSKLFLLSGEILRFFVLHLVIIQLQEENWLKGERVNKWVGDVCKRKSQYFTSYKGFQCMVILSDQLLKCYEIITKSKMWWKTFFILLM